MAAHPRARPSGRLGHTSTASWPRATQPAPQRGIKSYTLDESSGLLEARLSAPCYGKYDNSDLAYFDNMVRGQEMAKEEAEEVGKAYAQVIGARWLEGAIVEERAGRRRAGPNYDDVAYFEILEASY
ncbi:hypothetical protein SEVIR_4G117101v4 [Setaria viridis]